MTNVALVLSGGGARAAYQVGAMRAIAELHSCQANPFNILAGVSAGAINCVALATLAHDFSAGVRLLHETWMSLEPHLVYRTDAVTLGRLGARWLKDATTGGLIGASHSNYLLDTQPLRDMLNKRLETARIPRHIADGTLRALAISATNYASGNIVTFFDGAPALKPWSRHTRVAFREPITVEHVMASAAIPIFFPPVHVNGRSYGDGGLRMTTPASPAIHLGADKLLAIGIRHKRGDEETLQLNEQTSDESVSAAQISGVLLNALFLDSLDDDIARLLRVNRTLGFVPEDARSRNPDLLRRIPALLLSPSQDLGHLAANEYEKFPRVLRHLLRGIGATGESGWDLMSYLA
ncbi:MAG TPA: patatin-like phospholipase family protein, partial [Polyangiales bacterium]|nr:patatin-like phospholipase family protein [Polyangiales bacterium]